MAMHDILGATDVSMQLDTDTRNEIMRQVRRSIFFGDGSTDQPNRLRTVTTVVVVRKLTTLSSYTSS
jgi:hypothetical protein